MDEAERIHSINQDLPDPSTVLQERERFSFLCKALEENSEEEFVDTDDRDPESSALVDKVQHLKVVEETIKFIHPGVDVFDHEKMCCLFSADTLSLSEFGLNPGTVWGKCLLSITKEHLYTLILKRRFECNVHLWDVIKPLCQYLFFLMSVHGDSRIVHECKEVLTRHNLHYSPSFNDVLTVFINWGGAVTVLCPDLPDVSAIVPEPLRNILPVQSKLVVSDYNIQMVLQHLALHWSSCIAQTQSLLRMLLLATLDKKFRGSHIVGKFVDCICHIMSNTHWANEEVLSLIKMLHFKHIHFHNQTKACMYLIGRTKIVSEVGSALAYASLQQLILKCEHPQYVRKVHMGKISNLIQKKIDINDPYELYIIVTLLVYCMRDLPFHGEDEITCNNLIEWLSNMGRIVTSSQSLIDTPYLKELIARITSAWECLYQHLRKVHEYNSDMNAKIKQHHNLSHT